MAFGTSACIQSSLHLGYNFLLLLLLELQPTEEMMTDFNIFHFLMAYLPTLQKPSRLVHNQTISLHVLYHFLQPTCCVNLLQTDALLFYIN